MTTSYEDKYFGKVEDAVDNDGAGFYMPGIESAEKDSDTVGRFNEKFSVSVYYGTSTGTTGVLQNPDVDTGVY